MHAVLWCFCYVPAQHQKGGRRRFLWRHNLGAARHLRGSIWRLFRFQATRRALGPYNREVSLTRHSPGFRRPRGSLHRRRNCFLEDGVARCILQSFNPSELVCWQELQDFRVRHLPHAVAAHRSAGPISSRRGTPSESDARPTASSIVCDDPAGRPPSGMSSTSLADDTLVSC